MFRTSQLSWIKARSTKNVKTCKMGVWTNTNTKQNIKKAKEMMLSVCSLCVNHTRWPKSDGILNRVLFLGNPHMFYEKSISSK